MIFRQFVEEMKDAAAVQANLSISPRDLTPFLYLQSEGAVEGVGLDPMFFESETSRRGLLVMALSLIRTRRPEHVAWVMSADAQLENDERVPVLAVVALDRERDELWTARLYRRDDGVSSLGGWNAETNVGMGYLVTPIQEALR